MRVRRAFYKANWRHPIDILIAGWTWPFNIFHKPIFALKFFSHEEIGFVIGGEWRYFSSSVRKRRDNDGNVVDGTRWMSGKTLFKHPERWEVYERDYSEEKVKSMIRLATSEENKGYDKLGVCGFLTLTGQLLNNKFKWYCSEVCRYIASLGVWMKRVSPIKDWKLIMRERYTWVERSQYLVV